MFLRPAFDNHFLVSIELDRVPSLRVQVAKEAALPPGKGEICHGRGNSDVDPDIAGRRFMAESAR